ncbi:MAG: YkgJ family cysteine cluster protein [Thermoanaerobaculia bacterium]
MGKGLKILYDCKSCPAYCCSYPRIVVTKTDIRRLAKYFGLTPEETLRKFTKKGEEPGERVLRHKKDEIYGSACRFLDRETRMCTVYRARPGICRDYPGTRRCGYWEFLKFERMLQEDPEFIPTAYNP